MLTKEEKKELNTTFWRGFKNFSKRYKSCSGKRINWINYPSDVTDIYIRLHADTSQAMMTFDIQCRDSGVRSVFWEQMLELRSVMEKNMPIKPIWIEQLNLPDGLIISRIEWHQKNLNYMNLEDHSAFYQFFMSILLPFDLFYQEFKDILVSLAD